jgi:arginyl-tRNA synthetase
MLSASLRDLFMNILTLLEERLCKALENLGISDKNIYIKPCSNPKYGDYQCDGIIGFAKKNKQQPRDVAQQVATELDLKNIASKIEVAGAGFVNIFLDDNFLTELATKTCLDSKLGIAQETTIQTIVVDYSSPNLAKEMHVGHLRSTILGDSMVRVLSFLGHKVIRQNHIGDWGTQFGMLIAYLEELEENSQEKTNMELFNLEKFYREAKKKFDEDPEFAQKSREYVVNLQSGDPLCTKSWKKFVDITLKHCQLIYKRLQVLLTENDIMGESAYEESLPIIIQTLQEHNMLKQDQGAQVVFLEQFKNKEGNPIGVIVEKSGGGFLYTTTDLAAIRHRYATLNADRIIYYVDSRQSQHFAQVFAIARQANLVAKDTVLEHHAFGMMLGKDNRPFKSRSGENVKLNDLLNEAEERAAVVVSQKSDKLTEEQKCAVIKCLSIASIKYADLCRNRNSDYVFDWDKMLSFEGNTAPYLLYAYTRINSLFAKVTNINYKDYPIIIEQNIERKLILLLCSFSEIIARVAKEGLSHLICNYLYEVASVFMQFYEACPINKDNISTETKCSRLKICELTQKVLGLGFYFLGIEPVDKL